ncbi:MAG: tetratricopeptide repeat protein [Promethearchaeota archaeon]
MRPIDFELERQIERAKNWLIERNNIKAIELLSKILDKNPTNDKAWLYLGIAKRRMGAYNEAIDCFRLATEHNKSLVEAWGLLALTLVDCGKLKNAKEILGNATLLNPHNATIKFLQYNLLRFYKKYGPFF